MRTIAITGVGGLLGRALVEELARRGATGRIVAIDVVDPQLERLLASTPAGTPAAQQAPHAGGAAPEVVTHLLDVRDDGMRAALEGVDVLVHLAFQMDPIRDLERMRSINLDGTRNVLESARAAGVGRVVYLSSVVAYGAHPDNDVPLTETSPLRGTPGFPYSEHKRDVEAWLWPWHAAGEGPALTVLRSAAVMGPGVQNFITRLLELPVLPVVDGQLPPLQFVHLDDVVSAIIHAIDEGLDGVFNVAPDGWLEHDRLVGLIPRGTVEVSAELLTGLVDRSLRLGVGELPPAIVALFRHPWVLSNERLRATGWEPTSTNEEALLEAVLEHAPFVALGRLRVRRSQLRLALLAGLAAATLAAVARRR
jgi:nucleoside-diphosphate-sugar epimerase